MADDRIAPPIVAGNARRGEHGKFQRFHVDLPIGEVFDRLTVAGDERRIGKKYWVTCRCDCGEEVLCDVDQLKRGKKKQCGAHRRVISNTQRAAIGQRNRKHGHAKSGEYNSWVGMKARCLNPDNDRYSDYGGRGITIDPAWIGSFEAFLRDVGPRPSAAHSLDRINVDGNYVPENVRWADRKTQVRNLRPFIVTPGKRAPKADISPAKYIAPSPIPEQAHHNTKHGMSGTPEYEAWRAILKRCNNPKHPAYANYGGRGIKMAPEWECDFTAFIRDVGMKPDPSYSIDRIDNDAGYCPGNVRWADGKTQNRNRRAFVMRSRS